MRGSSGQPLPQRHSMDYTYSITEAINRIRGRNAEICSAERVSGGDINRAYRLELDDGSLFMKTNAIENRDFFRAEVAGLEAISSTKTIRVPQVLGIGEDPLYGAFLLLEWSRGKPKKEASETFGRNLAAMHRADTSGILANGCFGFPADNYIGAGRQKNTPCEKWISFFRDYRLLPQFTMAEEYFDEYDRACFTRLVDHLDQVLIEPDAPSLLHGDLWAGNYIIGYDGEAWLIDPAAYIGHAEADLAMTELFGGFSSSFYGAYREINPLQPGYDDRRDLYNLYHLMNHLYLFGWSYLGSVRSILRKYGGHL